MAPLGCAAGPGSHSGDASSEGGCRDPALGVGSQPAVTGGLSEAGPGSRGAVLTPLLPARFRDQEWIRPSKHGRFSLEFFKSQDVSVEAVDASGCAINYEGMGSLCAWGAGRGRGRGDGPVPHVLSPCSVPEGAPVPVAAALPPRGRLVPQPPPPAGRVPGGALAGRLPSGLGARPCLPPPPPVRPGFRPGPGQCPPPSPGAGDIGKGSLLHRRLGVGGRWARVSEWPGQLMPVPSFLGLTTRAWLGVWSARGSFHVPGVT